MSLRRKLLVAFGGLAAIALLVAGLTLWETARWTETSARMEAHYQRSLLLQRVRAATFQALKEVPDAVHLGDARAREEFGAAIKPATTDLDTWAGLADTAEEREEIEAVRQAFGRVVADAERAFALVEGNDLSGAAVALEDELEATTDRFQAVAGAAVERDRARRQEVRAAVEEVRRTAYVILAIASFGTLSLVLLLAAYLASDLFRPLREVVEALDGLAQGRFDARLDEGRGDEIGAVQYAFNKAAQSLGERERLASLASPDRTGAPAGSGFPDGAGWRDMPSRVALHGLVTRLKVRLASLGERAPSPDGAADAQGALRDAEALLATVERLAAFGFPLDLHLARTDLRALIYDVLPSFRDEMVRRGVSCEVVLDPTVGEVVVDRLKLREAVGEALRNALAAMPETGGRLGLRTARRAGGGTVALEVADNGSGMAPEVLKRVTERNPFDVPTDGERAPGTGLALAKAVAERHGGRLEVLSRLGVGTVVRIEMPETA